MAMVSASDFVNMARESDFHINASTTSYDLKQNAFLYFFTPRKVPDVTIRPYYYRFDGVFVDDLSNVVAKCYTDSMSSVGANAFQNAYMPGIDSANRSVVPAANGVQFSGSYYDQLWTFLLVIDNAPIKGRVRTAKLSNRLIYTGFCMEEPASMLHGIGKVLLNPNCLLIPTHFTHMNIKTIMSPHGVVTNPILEQDSDVLHPDHIIRSSINGDRSYLLRPEDVINTTGITSDGYNYSVPELANLNTRTSAMTLDTITKSPKQHIHQLVSGMTKFVLERESSRMVSSDVNDHNVFGFDTATEFQRIKDNMTSKTADRILGIRLDHPIVLADVLAEYPSIEYNSQVIEIPFNPAECPMEDAAPNPINIYSSLINSSMSAILPRYGISDVMFRYASFNPMAMSMFENQSSCQVFDIQTFMPGESQDTINLRWQNALRHLQDHIFPIIIANAGNFDVLISYRSAGECFCQLQLVDMTDTINDGKIMTNGVFGGLQSPLVGTIDHRTNNETSIMETVGSIVGTDYPLLGKQFNGDDNVLGTYDTFDYNGIGINNPRRLFS